MIYLNDDFDTINASLWHILMDEADEVFTGHWQSLKGTPHAYTLELFRVCVETPIPQTQEDAALWIEPNLPWAEDHFQERVGGVPTNPGSQYMNWPWYDPDWAAQKARTAYEGFSNIMSSLDPETFPPPQFSHTYQERMWPRKANTPDLIGVDYEDSLVHGIRFRYGDLNDVVNLLAREPTTRQAYLPIWFPEDTGAHHGERVPCTLGYQFILRGGLLHVTYHIRSCDFLRYFRDDVYMAMRLGQWILAWLIDRETDAQPEQEIWNLTGMGILQMNITSLHVFEGDMSKMRREAPPTP